MKNLLHPFGVCDFELVSCDYGRVFGNTALTRRKVMECTICKRQTKGPVELIGLADGPTSADFWSDFKEKDIENLSTPMMVLDDKPTRKKDDNGKH